ncbi:MAG: nuclear transport factor 2 family protein [Pseudomonadota bacterium]
MPFTTAQEAEDAYYDALEEGDLDKLMSVWADDDNIGCLLPMQPLATGRAAVTRGWQELFEAAGTVDLQASHVTWIDLGDAAIHLVEEIMAATPGAPPPPGVYATNIFVKGPDGWRLVMHQNSPLPPPPGFQQPGMSHLP